jgi:hypothetical protein
LDFAPFDKLRFVSFRKSPSAASAAFFLRESPSARCDWPSASPSLQAIRRPQSWFREWDLGIVVQSSGCEGNAGSLPSDVPSEICGDVRRLKEPFEFCQIVKERVLPAVACILPGLRPIHYRLQSSFSLIARRPQLLLRSLSTSSGQAGLADLLLGGFGCSTDSIITRGVSGG